MEAKGEAMSELVVFDTNVFVSYLLPTKKITAVKLAVARIFDKTAAPVYSSATIAEYVRVLHYDKFAFPPERIKELLTFLLQNGLYVNPASSSAPFTDVTDKCFYDAVLATGA